MLRTLSVCGLLAMLGACQLVPNSNRGELDDGIDSGGLYGEGWVGSTGEVEGEVHPSRTSEGSGGASGGGSGGTTGQDEGGSDESGQDEGSTGAEYCTVDADDVYSLFEPGSQERRGEVSITAFDTELVIDIESDEGWQLDKAQLHVSTAVPDHRPGHYGVQLIPDDGATVSHSSSATELGAGCGVPLYVAVHIDVSQSGATAPQVAGAWAEGDHEFSGQQGGYIELEYCCD